MLTGLGANKDLFLRSLNFTCPTSSGVDSDGNPRIACVNQQPGPDFKGGDYVFLGGAGVTPVEGSEFNRAFNTPSQLIDPPDQQGFFQRDSAARWTPQRLADDGGLQAELSSLVTRAPVGYPAPPAGQEAAYAAAEKYLYTQLLQTNGGPLCDPSGNGATTCSTVPDRVRANYLKPEFYAGAGSVYTDDLRCGDTSSAPDPAGPGYTSAQLHALRVQICGEVLDIKNIDTDLFAPLAEMNSALSTSAAIDLIGKGDGLLGFLQQKMDAQVDQTDRFLGIGGTAGAILSQLAQVVTSALQAVQPEASAALNRGVAIANSIADGVGVSGSVVSLLSGAVPDKTAADTVAPEEITIGDLVTHVEDSFGAAQTAVRQQEAVIISDPTKAHELANLVAHGHFDLGDDAGDAASGHRQVDVVRFAAELGTLQYVVPRMLSVVTTQCDTGGSADDPLTPYEAAIAFNEASRPDGHDILVNMTYKTARLQSVHLTSAAKQPVADLLWSDPMNDPARPDPLAQPPGRANLTPSPFFMHQVAPNSGSQNGSCRDDYNDSGQPIQVMHPRAR
jgi:hypothetical protein